MPCILGQRHGSSNHIHLYGVWSTEQASLNEPEDFKVFTWSFKRETEKLNHVLVVASFGSINCKIYLSHETMDLLVTTKFIAIAVCL